jgi:hypothetical protein
VDGLRNYASGWIEKGIAGGIGEDQVFPIFARCTSIFNSKTNISLLGGVRFGGE